jgi:hypothetical protein
VAVPHADAADEAGAGDGGLDDGDVVGELGLEDAVGVGWRRRRRRRRRREIRRGEKKGKKEGRAAAASSQRPCLGHRCNRSLELKLSYL